MNRGPRRPSIHFKMASDGKKKGTESPLQPPVQPLRTFYNKASGYPDAQIRLSFAGFEGKEG
jgi:hypothetical protein